MGKEERRPQQRRMPGAAWVARSHSATRQAPTRSNDATPVRERGSMERESAERGGDGRVVHIPWPYSPPLAQPINTEMPPTTGTYVKYCCVPAYTSSMQTTWSPALRVCIMVTVAAWPLENAKPSAHPTPTRHHRPDSRNTQWYRDRQGTSHPQCAYKESVSDSTTRSQPESAQNDQAHKPEAN